MYSPNKRLISFISEHTTEFILVPKISALLGQYFTNVTSIYFWSSREGSGFNKGAFENEQIRVLVLFPRRPKVSNYMPGLVFVKFNESLFDKCNSFHKHGVPVIAGLPLASKIEDIHSKTNCMWFQILPEGEETIEMVQMDNPGEICVNGVQSISDGKLIELIKTEAAVISWAKFLEIVKQAYYEERNSWFIFGIKYKPVYFFMRD